MSALTRSERKAVSIMLALFVMLHSPFAGLMTASAMAPGNGGFMVICTDDGFREFPGPSDTSAPGHSEGCTCPPGQLCSGGAALGEAAQSAPGLFFGTTGKSATREMFLVLRNAMRGPGTPRSPPVQVA